MTQTGIAIDPKFKNHNFGPVHPESPKRYEIIVEQLEATGLIGEVSTFSPISDTSSWLLKVHSDGHVRSVQSVGTSGEIAELAVSYALGAVDSVASGKLKNAFCAVRPPGHHAHNNGGDQDGQNQGEGFCFYNSIAIAARYAQQKLGLKKILIADFDYHHGNGTEWAFYSDPSVLFFSTHALYDYPGTGNPGRMGEGEGYGYNINAPLERGAGDIEILNAFEKQLLPKAEEFKPDLILVSAGFDSRVDDFLGTFRVTDDGFSRLTRMLMDLAGTHCGGKIVSFLEGGYNPQGAALAAMAHLKTLTGL